MAVTSNNKPVVKQPAQVDHACGHRFTHLLPAHETGSLELFDLLASHACPVCLMGMIDWSQAARGDDTDDTNTGVC